MTSHEVDVLDILDINSKILLSFENDWKNLPKYKELLTELEKTFNCPSITTKAKTELEKSIKDLKDKCERIESREDLNFYTIETVEILEKYRQILKTPMKVSFMGKQKTTDPEKNELLKKYTEIAQRYYPINTKQTERKFKMSCDSCSNCKDFATEENAYICLECGSQQEIIHHTSSYKDSDRVNITAKYTYDRKVHFRDCINQYQGKQNCSIEQKVYDQLEDILARHHLLIGDKSEKKEIRFSKITKEHILMFLKELGFPKHYENVNLIHYNMTGKKPDDISHLEDKLLADFDILVETYDKQFKHKVDRVNFISTQYVLYQLLQRYKHPCRKEDFVILKTMDRKSFHDTITKDLFDALGWNFVPLY
jgi:hypothetical protein